MIEEDTKLTPMMRQYREAKAQIPPDAILLFRLGDFYEMFFEDAEKASAIMELVLTKRAGVPMCGFPYHALEAQLAGLGRARVADLTAAERELVSQGRKGAGSTLLTRSQAARPFDRKKTSLPLNSGTTF